MMSVKPAVGGQTPVTFTRSGKEGFIFYRVVSLPSSGGQTWLACAGRAGGVGVSEFWGEKEGEHKLSTVTFDGLDVVDVCPIGSGASPR